MAVSAMIGTCRDGQEAGAETQDRIVFGTGATLGKKCRKVPMLRYSLRKSCPHCAAWQCHRHCGLTQTVELAVQLGSSYRA